MNHWLRSQVRWGWTPLSPSHSTVIYSTKQVN